MSDAPIVIEISDKISPEVPKKIKQIGDNAKVAHDSVTRLKAALVQIGRTNPVARLQSELAKLNGEMAKSALTSQRLATEQQRTAQAAQRLATEQQRTARATAQLREAEERARTASQRLATEQQRTASALAQAEAAKTRAAIATQRLADAQRRGEQQAQRYGRMQAWAAGQVRMLVGLLGGFVAIRGVYGTLAEFDEGIARLSAVSRASSEDLDRMKTVIQELGATTEFTAGQVADGMTFLALAGYNAEQSIAAIPATLNLATAASLELGNAADIMTNIMSAYGIAAEDAASAADILAATNSRANTDVQQLGDAMAYVGPIASSLGVSMNDTAAAIGILSNAGTQGSMAGTGLRRVMSSLVNPTRAARDELARMGLSMADVNPATNDLTTIVQRLADAGLDTSQAFTIFGDRGGPAIMALTSQTGDLQRLTGELRNVNGAAQEMADTMRDSLAGDMRNFISAVQGLIIALGESGLTAAIRAVLQAMTAFVRLLTENVDRLVAYGQAGAIVAAVFGGIWVTSFVAAKVATLGLAGALGLLRTALIRTGIGAIIVLLGELILYLTRTVEKVGGLSTYFGILGDTGKAALDWIIAGGYSMIDAFEGITLTIGALFTSLWASVQAGFAALMQMIQAGINRMIDGINDALDFELPGWMGGGRTGRMISTRATFADGYVAAAAASAAAAEDLGNRAGAAFERMGNRFADLQNPLEVYRNGVAAAAAEIETATTATNELAEATAGNGGGGTGEGGGGGGGGRGRGGGGGLSGSLAEVISQMDQELELLKLLPKEREIERELQKKVNELREKGVNLSQQEVNLLRERIGLLREANAVAEQEAALMNATVYAREQFIHQLQAIQNLLNNPESGFTSGDAMRQLAQSEIGAYLEHLPEMVSARVEHFRSMYEQINALRDADLISEQSASAARMQIWAAEQKAKTQLFSDFFGGIAVLASSENEKLARIGKAAAITQTIIKTYQSATEAYAAMAGVPVVGPALGAAAAAAAIAAGMANVAAIRAQGTSTGYMTGGYTGDLPRTQAAGVVHGREYVMDAATTSRIGLDDLDALRRGAATVQRPEDAPASTGRRVSTEGAGGAAGEGAGATVNARIINVIDPALLGDYLATPEGEAEIMNIIRRNGDKVKQVMQNG